MKKILLNLVFACSVMCSLSLQADIPKNDQDAVVDRLLLVRNICTSEVDICSSDIYLTELSAEEGLSVQLVAGSKGELYDSVQLSANSYAAKSSKNSQKLETYAVAITIDGGYTFHIADYYGYYGHSRVQSHV